MRPRPPGTRPPLTADNRWDWRTQALLVEEAKDKADAEVERLAAENERMQARLMSLGALAVRRRTALNASNANNVRLAAANKRLIARIHDLETELSYHLPDPSPNYEEA